MTRSVNITFRGKEVHNPLLRKLIVSIVIPVASVAILLVPIAMILVVLLSPVWVPMHLVLKAFGRRGFVVHEGQSMQIDINLAGFRKAS